MFDDIRPYYDAEINAAMHRIARHRYFPPLSKFVFPGRNIVEVRKMLCAIDNIHDFQKKVMYEVNKRIIRESVSEFTYGGVENIDRDQSYLMVSNHRDIMLDASLLQNILVDNGLDTTEITFGANLMQMDIVVDIGKSNKMFKVQRPDTGMNIKDFYTASTHLSEYIRMVLRNKRQSVWIAQRNGRTKNGMDRTDAALVKMFSMSGKGDRVKSMTELNILPVSVSYEWEPCDLQKVVELCKSMDGPYTKRKGEDVESILNGILQFKGRVHFQICKAISREELERLDTGTANAFHKNVAGLIDRRICGNYKLFPNQYIAHDILHKSTQYAGHYTEGEKRLFDKRLAEAEGCGCRPDIARDIFLGIYANPLDSYNLFGRS